MNRIANRFFPFLLLVCLCASGCGRGRPFPPDVVARYDGGQVTVQQLEDRVLLEPPGQRMPPPDSGISLAEWRRRFARKIVAERTWRESMSEEAIDQDPRLRRQLAAAHFALLEGFASTQGLGLDKPVSEEETRQRYEERKARLTMPETFTVRHVYLRVDEGSPEAAWQAALERAQAVRALMVAPDANLDTIIATSSQSEDASEGGWIRRLRLGALHLSPAFEDAVRKLQPGEVSQPVRTLRGYQVVKLIDRYPARTLSFKEMKQHLMDEIASERRQQRLKALLEEARRVDPLELDLKAFATKDPKAVVLRASDGTAMTLDELATDDVALCAMLQQAIDRGGQGQQTYIDDILKGQWLVRHARRVGLDRSPELEKKWQAKRDHIIVEYIFQRDYDAWLKSRKEEEIRAFYEANKPRFSTPRQLHLKALFLQGTGPDRYPTYSLAEELARRLNGGEPFEPLVDQYAPGQGRPASGDLGWQTHEQIAARGKPFYDAVLAAEPGEWIGPVKLDRGYAVVKVEEVKEPVPQSFDQVHDRVRRAFARRMLGQHRNALADEIFARRHGELNEAYFRGET